MKTNIPGLAELQERRAYEERLRRARANGQYILMPQSATNIPGLADAQARQYSIAHEAQPQDAEALSGGVQGWQRYMGDFGLGINDTIVGGALSVPAEYILAPMGKASEAIFGGESMFTRGAQQLFDWDAAYKKASAETRNALTGGNATLADEIFHGAGTSVGYWGLGLGAGQLGNVLWGLSPMGMTILSNIVANVSEAITEGGSVASDTYAMDKSRYNDALLAGMYSLGINAPADMLQGWAAGGVENWLNTNLMPGASQGIRWLGKQVLKNVAKEEFDELLQEPRQQAIEEAVKRTFQSGDMSLANYGYNALTEGRKILPYKDEQGKINPGYFLDVAPATAGSTLLTSVLLAPFGLGGNVKQQTAHHPANSTRMEQLTTARDALQEELANTQAAQAANPDNQDLAQRAEGLKRQIDDLNQSIADVQDELDRETLDLYPTDEDATPPAGQDEQPIPPFNLNESNTTAAEEQDDLDGERYDQASKRRMGLRNSLSSFFDASLPLDDTRLIPPSPPARNANTARIRTMRGTEADIRYRVVDADDLITSTNERGAPNPSYPQELQPRQRDREASFQQIDRMANDIDPELLAESRLASNGAPVIGSDMVVESGNGRVMALRQAYKTGKADGYRSWLTESAGRFGLSARDFAGITKPVLVRERTSDVDRVRFASEANESSTAAFSATENAQEDARRMTPTILGLYDTSKTLQGNRQFLGAFIGTIPQSERGSLLQSNGSISRAGLERARNALAALAYGDNGILNRLSEVFDDDIENVSNALIQAAPKIAMFENSGRKPDLSLQKDIAEAVYSLANAREQGKSVEAYISQPNLFGDGISPAATTLLRFFDKNKRSAKAIAEGLQRYADLASREAGAGQTLMFEDSARSKGSILGEALSNIGRESYNQSSGGESGGTDTQSRASGQVRTLTVPRDGKTQTFTVHEGEFSDKHPKHKKLFGKYLDVRDSSGKSVARYSITGDKFSAAPDTDASLAEAVEHELRDKLGAMLRTGRSDTPHRRTAKPTEKKSVSERLHDFVFGQEGDSRSFFQRTSDTIAERKAFTHARKQIQEKIEKALSDLVGEKRDKQTIKRIAKLTSYVYAARLQASAHLAGMTIEELADIWSLEFEFSDEATNSRGTTKFQPAEYDKNGNLLHAPQTIVYLYEHADQSTMLHEAGHLFLNDMRRLVQIEGVPDSVLNDWATLTEWLGVSDLDLTRRTGELSEEERDRWTDAHEKFATAFEKYLMTNEAPTSKLRRAFEAFKQWLLRIYEHITNIRYAGKDGRMHSYHMSDEIRKVMDRMLQDVQYVPNAEAAEKSPYLTNEREIHRQPLNSDVESRAWSDTVDRFMNGELSRRTDGNLLHVMDTPDVFTLVGMERLPIEIHIGNMDKILRKKHHLSPETLKQIPQALTAPVMIFRSQHDISKDRDSRVILTELREKDAQGVERIIMAAITLGKANLSGGYAINELTTVYRKDTSSKQQLSPEEDIYDWITRTFKDGTPMNLLLYVNKEKARQGAMSPGLRPLVFDILNGLPDSIPDEHDLARLKSQKGEPDIPQASLTSTPDGFITPEALERFDQLAYHGTGHIIRGGRFNLSYVGTGEGGAAFGYGAYLSESQAVADTYRPARDTVITLKDGQTFSYSNSSWRNQNKALSRAMYQLVHYFEQHPNADGKEALSAVREDYEYLIGKHSRRGGAKSLAAQMREELEALNSIENVTQKFGNAYKFDIPENEDLLDWDAPLEVQSVKVKKGIRKIFAELSDMGYTKRQVSLFSRHMGELETGEDLYTAVKGIMTEYLAHNPAPADGMTHADARASMLFNKCGIPGHRYLDAHSRGSGKGTHNYVIWNMDKMEMLGLTPDSDTEAIEEFRREQEAPHRIGRTNDTLITPEEIERYDQLAYQGTPHTVHNRFNLKYIGTGEGSQVFGWGLYFAENRQTAESYRMNGRDELTITTKDGSVWRGDKDVTEEIYDAVYDYVEHDDRYTGDGSLSVEDIRNVAGIISEEILQNRDTLTEAVLSSLQAARKVLGNAASVELHGGNLYKVDLPGNDVLLDLNAKLTEQPPKVRRALHKFTAWLRGRNLSDRALRRLEDAGTGADFYHVLTSSVMPELMEKFERQGGTLGRINRADMAASLFLNRYGIPGLRFLDRLSRRKGSGTHNFVIWNTDLIKMLGVSEDSSEGAKQSFRQEHSDGEVYQQLIGQRAAARLDAQEHSQWRTHKLRLAEQMEGKGLSSRKIWAATGWARGADGEWRFELPYGTIRAKNIHRMSSLSRKYEVFYSKVDRNPNYVFTADEQAFIDSVEAEDMTLPQFFNAPELYEAYPRLRKVPVFFEDLNGASGMYSFADDAISIDYSVTDAQELRKTFVHEIQHAIQTYEGFNAGTGFDADKDAVYSAAKADYEHIINALDIASSEKVGATIDARLRGQNREFRQLIRTLSPEQLQAYTEAYDARMKMRDRENALYDEYFRAAGEVEARNAEKRAYWRSERRARTEPAASEDVERGRQIVHRTPRLTARTTESYNQSARSADDFTLTPEAQAQMDEVRRRYEGTAQWMRAPNGKPSKLTEQQWLAVRTPAFKRWFGDWEAAQIVRTVKDFLENSEPVASITGQEFQKGDTPLVDRVIDYYRETGNTVVTNEELGEVVLDRRGVKDSSAHGLGKEKAAAFAVVPDVIRNGLVYDRQSNWKGRKYDTATLIANVKIGGEDYVCEVIVKRGRDRQGFYLHEVELKKNLDGAFKTVLSNGTPSRSRLIISKYVEKTDSASKVVDENGEPLVVYHGTTAPIENIRTFERGTVGWLGSGIYLTPFTEYALQFSDKGEAGMRSLFLNLRKPLVLSSTWRIGRPYLELLQELYGDRADSIYKERYEAVAERDKEILSSIPDEAKRMQYIHRRIVTGEEVQQLLAQGYDGINWDDGEYSVLNPEQVKSATGNNGSFSSSDSDIYHQSISTEALNQAHSLASQIAGLQESYHQLYDSRELDALIKRNKRAELPFRLLMAELQEGLGGELITRKQMKTPERIINKAYRVFGGDVSRVGDVWAGTLVFDTEDELQKAIDKLRRRRDVVHTANRWSRPKRSTGYRDFEAHLALPDGTVVELQLQHKGIQAVKDNVGHSVYEFMSSNDKWGELHDYIWQAGDLSKRLYSAAMDGSYQALSVRDKDTLRALGENLADAEDAEQVAERIDALAAFMDEVLPERSEDAIDYFNRYRAEHPDGFITPEAVERFDQLRTHATGNIIYNNRFDLRYAGSSEGTAAFGHGAYFEESPEVAEIYRRYGRPGYDSSGRNGNVYHFEIPEDYELLDWNEPLEHQPERIKPIVRRIAEAINSNPAEFIAMGFAKDFKNPKAMQAKLQPLLEAIAERMTAEDIESPDSLWGRNNEWDRQLDQRLSNMPEYRQLKRIIHTDRAKMAVFKLYDHIGHKVDTHSATGETLYESLVDFMYTFTGRIFDEEYHAADRAAKVAASAYLNSQGIPGHRFLDRLSRYDKTGQNRTHNYVIWNMDKVRMVGLDPSSDDDAIDYYIKYHDYARRHGESEEMLTPEQLEAVFYDNHLVSPSQVERYEQLMYHGTDNTIKGGRFDLRFVGSSEGSASIAYGAYMAENAAVAHQYRHYGDPALGAPSVAITTNDGKRYRSMGFGRWDGEADAQLRSVLDDLRTMATAEKNPDLATLKRDILKAYKRELREQKHELTLAKKRGGSQASIEARKQYVDNAKKKIDALERVAGLSVIPARTGNLYTFDGPENDELLDWEAHITKQPEAVRTARHEILQELKRMGLDTAELKKAKTGREFYQALTRLAEAYPVDGIADPMQKASLILNKHGVPGTRYLDSYSRGAGEGTHNFVIWDADRLKMLGVEGNPEAEQEFRETGGERYNQYAYTNPDIQDTIDRFEDYGRELDEDTTLYINSLRENLDIANKQLDEVRRRYHGTAQWLKAPNGKNTNLTEHQWLAVRTPNFIRWFGDWENDPQNASKVVDDNGEPLVVYHGTRNGGFSVFDTMPDSRHLHTHDTGAWFTSSREGAAYYAPLNSQDDEEVYPVFLNIRNPYVHNAYGADWDKLADVQIKDARGWTVYVSGDDHIGSVEEAWEYIDEYLLRDELGNSIDNVDEDGNPLYTVESDGLETTDDIVRAVWSGQLGNGNHDGVIIRDVVDPDEAIDVFVTRTPENIKSAVRNNGEFSPADPEIYHQIIKRQGGSSFLQPEQLERFNQLMYHGTKNILAGNRFNLRYIGTGEGSQVFGYGIYLAQNKLTGESYRTAGMAEQEKAEAILIKDGHKYSDIEFWTYINNAIKNLRLYATEIGDRYSAAFNDAVFVRYFIDFAHGKYPSVSEARDAFVKHSLDEARKYKYPVDMRTLETSLRETAKILAPDDVKPAPNRKGNLYLVDGPEDFELLDWDATMTEQPQQVLEALKRSGLYLSDAETGEQLYRRLSRENGGDRIAAMKLNDAGIPGHRFWDAGSRGAKSGTHNFVIWNTDTLRLLGLSEDSEADAQDYYRAEDYYNAQLDVQEDDGFSEQYHQIIGIGAARRLDQDEHVTVRMDNLRVAKRMEKKLAPSWTYRTSGEGRVAFGIDDDSAKKIWLATGWFRGTDGHWKFELPYGKVKLDELNALVQHIDYDDDGEPYISGERLDTIFDAPQLFKAYPRLRNYKVSF